MQFEEISDKQAEVEIINSIKEKYKSLRQASKSPTFALTYQGTWRTLVQKCGFDEDTAKHIEKQYHLLYKESDDWVQNKLDKASVDGYITGAFGLKVRTPLLKQVIRGNSKTPKEAEAEGRTAGNALGQSYGLLNTRAGIEFNTLVRKSNFKYDIKPMCHIHDAQYFLIRDNVETLLFLNKYLVKAVQWQEDEAIKHDQVHLGGEVSVFFPDWAHECEIPNNVTEPKLEELVNTYMEKLNG